MSIADNKALAERFGQVWTTEGLHLLDELADPDIVVSYPIPPEPMQGVDAFRAFITEFLKGVPDVTVTVDDMVAEGDKVACRWTMRGTHEGPLFGFPPTGRTIENDGFTFYRIRDGKVVEEIGMGNSVALMEQLGAGS